jgi:tRNA nucleotidyltransferase (CCA-adding enzyme)
MNTIEKQVLERIKPSGEEKNRLENTVAYLMERAREIAAGNGIPCVNVLLVGSAARNTWISGTHDLDIFLAFDPALPREKLEEYGLFIGDRLAQEAESRKEKYAEHPYTRITFSGFDVDIVPCYRVETAEKIISAVDRTPFHNLFVREHIRGLEDEVLLLKQFMKSGGVYGSELKTGGFSGYLTELLIIHYGSFRDVLEAAVSWKPGKTIEMVAARRAFDEPLTMVDPTDPGRNVAAALTPDKFACFISLAGDYLENPAPGFFEITVPSPMSDEEIRSTLEKRNTGVLTICFEAPEVVDDILYPQLFKMQKAVELLLEEHDFHVIKTHAWAGNKTVLTVELENASLSNVRKHIGPPVWVREHAEVFRKKYSGKPGVFAFYIEDGRYVAELPRKYPHAKVLLEAQLRNISAGKHINRSIREGYEILTGEEILGIMDEGYRTHLRDYL